MEILANVGLLQDAARARDNGADGIGLLRTEFLFFDALTEPSMERQIHVYSSIFELFPTKRVVARVFDASQEKALRFLVPLDASLDMGERGIRILRSHEDVLRRQLVALSLAADATGSDLTVLAPMICTLPDAIWFKEFALQTTPNIKPGVMIETPAACLNAAAILEAVPYGTVGTNDLSQFTFAADRRFSKYENYLSPWQPVTLRLLRTVFEASHAVGATVGVCGAAASDPALVPILVALGAQNLSVPPNAVKAIRHAALSSPPSDSVVRRILEADDEVSASRIASTG